VADGRDGDATPTPTVVEDRRWAVVVAGAFGGCSGVRREGNRTPPDRLEHLRAVCVKFAGAGEANARAKARQEEDDGVHCGLSGRACFGPSRFVVLQNVNFSPVIFSEF
jgi:hypothetical protein